MTSVRQLGYLGLEVSDLAKWEHFAVDLLGLVPAERGLDGSLALRLDERAQRIVLHPGSADDLAYLGFECANDAELDALGARLAAAGFAIGEGKPETAAARRVARLLELRDPTGIPVELFVGAAIAKDPFQSSRVFGGFVTGDEGLGHAVICAKDAGATERFYAELLGLRLSDTVVAKLGPIDLKLRFLHANARHHSIAFASLPMPKRIHHFMIEANSADDVGRAYDRCIAAGVQFAMSLGKHPNDGMTSFYATTPSGFAVEFGSGGLKVDDRTWTTKTYDQISVWGHKPPAAAPRPPEGGA